MLACLLLVFAIPSFAQQAKAPTLFDDVPRGHWAYQAIDSLWAAGVLVGYPRDYFKNPGRHNEKEVLTRYEFAVALNRALKWAAEPIENASKGKRVRAALPRLDPVQSAAFRRLVAEFKVELIALGWTDQRIERSLQRVAPAFVGRSEPFRDVPTNHWAYQAVEDLRQKGILIGYPDGTFNGPTGR